MSSSIILNQKQQKKNGPDTILCLFGHNTQF